MESVSVIICSHNPNPSLLDEVIAALKCQTLPTSCWSLLIIDNASSIPIQSRIDLSWHPDARVVQELTLGLTHARLKGLTEVNTDIIVFVDDDNILSSNYLIEVLSISQEFPFLGAWGGSLIPRYEVDPPQWFLEYSYLLALRKVDIDRWSNIPDWSLGACPAGAGLCIRKQVADKYSHYCISDPLRTRLGRAGSEMMGCEDIDLAFTACDIGMGTGVFSRLSLIHVIPKTRIQKDYLIRIEQGNAASSLILDFVRGRYHPTTTICQQNKRSIIDKLRSLASKFLRMFDRNDDLSQQFSHARERGRRIAKQVITDLV